MLRQTYMTRRQAEDRPGAPAPAPQAQGPSLQALRAGAAPTQEQLGSRVDLPGAIREKMEASFGADLSAVRLYESQAVADAGAQAMTMGNRVAFAPGQLDFVSAAGQSLLGHELSHVVSQARGEVPGSGFLNDNALEARADREGALAAAGESVCAGPAAPLSASNISSAAGPMQARKANSKEKMQSKHFNPLKGVSTSGENPVTGGYVFNQLFGDREARGGVSLDQEHYRPEDIIGGTKNMNRQQVTAEILKARGRGEQSPFSQATEDRAGYTADTFGDEQSGKISGNVFHPAKGKDNGKKVILYSGSGGNNLDQMHGNIAQYLSEGYTVCAYDYGGFGKSTTGKDKKGKDAAMSEATMQRDAQRIYDHVLGEDGKAEDVLLHGFSMGGPMAAMVARNAAIKSSKSGKAEDLLGGLVLESAMKNTADAASSTVDKPIINKLAGAISQRMYGSFDTGASLEEISELDQQMPITFISGHDQETDFLSDSRTQLSSRAKAAFGENGNIHSFLDRDLSQEGHMNPYKLAETKAAVTRVGGLMRRRRP